MRINKTGLNVLVACEESQRICTEFRKLGVNAFSCDIQECSGGHPEWHIQGDCLRLINIHQNGFLFFTTQNGALCSVDKWNLIIAHPPCTYLTVTGNRWFDIEKYGRKALERIENQRKAADFFMQFVNCNCEHVAIENPIGKMSSLYRKPDQIIQPFWFGDPARKSTCLWLKGLPCLVPTNKVDPIIIRYKNGKGTDNPWHMNTINLPKAEREREAKHSLVLQKLLHSSGLTI